MIIDGNYSEYELSLFDKYNYTRQNLTDDNSM